MTEFFSERSIMATRKQYHCEACETHIEPGSPARYYAGKFEGDFYSAHYHVECREAEIDWNRQRDTWGEDFESLNNIWEDDEVSDQIEWLRNNHPIAFCRIMSAGDFQHRVDRWMGVCFGWTIKNDMLERADRFIEESLELAQTFPEFTADRAHALVDYVFSRPIGERKQEVGGVKVTLAALCNAAGLSSDDAGEAELARVWTKVDQIRAKQASKPTGSALPVALSDAPGIE